MNSRSLSGDMIDRLRRDLRTQHEMKADDPAKRTQLKINVTHDFNFDLTL